jgi:hypothetical protein
MSSLGSRNGGIPCTIIPPSAADDSNSVTACPASRKSCAQASPAGPPADNRHALTAVGGRCSDRFAPQRAPRLARRLDPEARRDEAFERPNRHRCIDRPPSAFRLARRRADAPADRREGIRPPRDAIRIGEAPLGDRRHVTPGVGVHRAGRTAGDVLQPPARVGENRREREGAPGASPFRTDREGGRRHGAPRRWSRVAPQATAAKATTS